MTDHHRPFDPNSIQPIWLSVPRKFVLMLVGGVALGLLAAWLGCNVNADGWRRLQLAYLVAFCFVLTLSLGSLFIVLIQHLTRAGWSVVIRRPAEIFSLNILTVGLLALPIAWWVQRGEVYPWAQIGREHVSSPNHDAKHNQHPELHPAADKAHDRSAAVPGKPVAHLVGDPHSKSGDRTPEQIIADLYVHQQVDDLTLAKQPWLNRAGYLGRMLLYFGVWGSIAGFYYWQSRRQDLVADQFAATRRMEWVAGVAAIAFGLSLTFASFDWLMSLDPHWYSTMFGVYFFSGCAVGGFAANLLVSLMFQRWGIMKGLISDEHRRDLGRFLFAFVFFWGYIAFSQYMLLWYANVPETTRWFAVRGASLASDYGNSWGWLLLALLFGHFLIPFLGIMSRHVKSHSRAMVFWTSWLLVMHYLDLYWLVMPELGPRLIFGLIELGTLLAVVCVWLLGASFFTTKTSLLPVGDPRLSESMRAVEMY